jgi:hypothetical protein
LVVIETIDSEIAFLTAARSRIAGGGMTRESLAADFDNEKAARIKGDPDPDHQRMIDGQYAATAHGLTNANPELPIGEYVARLKHFLQVQRDRMAKASGIMFPLTLSRRTAGSGSKIPAL